MSLCKGYIFTVLKHLGKKVISQAIWNRIDHCFVVSQRGEKKTGSLERTSIIIINSIWSEISSFLRFGRAYQISRKNLQSHSSFNFHPLQCNSKYQSSFTPCYTIKPLLCISTLHVTHPHEFKPRAHLGNAFEYSWIDSDTIRAFQFKTSFSSLVYCRAFFLLILLIRLLFSIFKKNWRVVLESWKRVGCGFLFSSWLLVLRNMTTILHHSMHKQKNKPKKFAQKKTHPVQIALSLLFTPTSWISVLDFADWIGVILVLLYCLVPTQPFLDN